MKYTILLIALILMTTTLASDLCVDSDKGGEHRTDSALQVRGDVKYGITTQTDTCLTSEEGVSINKSNWLKEYYCRNDKREYTVYDCARQGYAACENGACVNSTTISNTSTTTTTTTTTTTNSTGICGNKIVEKAAGEECDPPYDICFGKSKEEYGTCQQDCTCKIAAAALKNLENKPAICGDGIKQTAEECEEDAHCSDNYLCSSCKCVKQLTKEEIEAMKTQKVKTEKTPEQEIEEKYNLTTEMPEIEITAENFSDTPAIKATSGITRFFKGIFSWIAGLFN